MEKTQPDQASLGREGVDTMSPGDANDVSTESTALATTLAPSAEEAVDGLERLLISALPREEQGRFIQQLQRGTVAKRFHVLQTVAEIIASQSKNDEVSQ